MKNNKLFFPALTGYRAIAAWIIFIYHFFPFNNSKFPIFIKNIVGEFHFGVDLFFVLSGFLITYRYFDQVKIDFKQYMVNRFARIYPMYFLMTILVFLVGYIKALEWNIDTTTEFVLSITMLKALFTKYFLSGVPQGWTLTLEELFYFTAPFYFLLIKKSKKWLFILPFIVLLFGMSLKTIFNFESNTWGFLQSNIYVFIFEFFAGIFLAIFIKNKSLEFKYKWVTYFGLLMLVIYVSFIQFLKPYINFKSDIARSIELIGLSLFGILPLLWGLINEQTIIQKFLSSKYMVLLGKSSYIFYLIHKGFIPIFINDYLTSNKLLLFIILNIISILMYTYLEEPLNNFIRKIYKQKTST
ncbi:acyltransferase family protein [Empedobacter sedimenti]|uniref:acyltransferase family protein n=1 Tax=Empedobacter sedimenti TaxID=3042610 RepID=UPI0024A65069|nr:acyltransferase [Empedobacter sedimenti]